MDFTPKKQAFPSKFDSRCANPSCAVGATPAFPNAAPGKILRGQMIRWSRGSKPAKVWHDGPCYESRYLGANGNNGDASGDGDNIGCGECKQAKGYGHLPTCSRYDAICSECSYLPKYGHHPECSKRLDQDASGESSAQDSSAMAESSAQGVSTQVVKTPPRPVSSVSGDSFLSGMADALAPYLDSKLSAMIDADQVRAIVKKALGTAILQTVTTVEVMDYKADEMKDLGLQHRDFAELLMCCNSRTADGHRLNIWLTGPAGSGKTTAAKNCAKALGLPYRFTGSIDTEYKLMGFMDAQGRIVNTQFREAYQNGGVFLFDEVDSSLPGALLAFNAALANGEAAFPDGIVNRHADFCCIAAANTWGLGANSDYVGRLKLDAAFLDRFAMMAWGIDEALELATSGNMQWTKRVQSLRKAALSKGVKSIISPRASYFGAALLKSGMDQERVEAKTIRKAMSDDQWAAVVGCAAIAGGK